MRLNAGFHDLKNGDSRQDFYPKSPSLRPAGVPSFRNKDSADYRDFLVLVLMLKIILAFFFGGILIFFYLCSVFFGTQDFIFAQFP